MYNLATVMIVGIIMISSATLLNSKKLILKYTKGKSLFNEDRYILSILACLLSLISSVFKMYLFDYFGFKFILVTFSIGIFLIVMTILSLVSFIKREEKKSLKAFIINISVLLFIIIVPVSEVAVRLDFYNHLEEREQIISMIKQEKFKDNEEYQHINGDYKHVLIQLPNKFKHLSRGGREIIVEKEGENLKVFFYTFSTILDNFSGFAYISDNASLNEVHFDGISEIKKMKEHWFYGFSS